MAVNCRVAMNNCLSHDTSANADVVSVGVGEHSIASQYRQLPPPALQTSKISGMGLAHRTWKWNSRPGGILEGQDSADPCAAELPEQRGEHGGRWQLDER